MPEYKAIITVTDHWGRNQTAGGEWVYELESTPVNTGIVNSNGTPLYRMPEARPIGFDLTMGKSK